MQASVYFNNVYQGSTCVKYVPEGGVIKINQIQLLSLSTLQFSETVIK